MNEHSYIYRELGRSSYEHDSRNGAEVVVRDIINVVYRTNSIGVFTFSSVRVETQS